jgi:hypothetical protein
LNQPELFVTLIEDDLDEIMDCPTSDSEVTKDLSPQDIVDSCLAKDLCGPLTRKVKDQFI